MLLEGSPSKSANLKAVVELKFMLAAINQSTPVIEYNLLTDSVAPFSILLASSMKLTFCRSSFISSSLYMCQGDGMGLDHNNEPLFGLSSRLLLVVSDLVSDLDVPATPSFGWLTGPIPSPRMNCPPRRCFSQTDPARQFFDLIRWSFVAGNLLRLGLYPNASPG